jgi:hypothetical protein
MWDILGNWINAILTIAIISFAVPGENIFYRIAEYIMIGITAGYAVVQGIRVVLNLGISPMMSGQAYMLLPILLGLLVYTRFSKQYGYLSRWPIALMVGSGIGVSIRAVPEVDIMNQIKASFLPLVGVNWDVAVSNIILLIALLSTLFYFFMTVEQKGPLRQISVVGRYSLMILFGAYWGSQLMTRSTMFIGRMSFLIKDFLFPMLGLG